MNINKFEYKRENVSKFFKSLSSENLSYGSAEYVMYNFDFQTGKYIFMSPSVSKLTGYNIHELNKIGFKNIVEKVAEKKENRYKINGGKNLTVEEYFAKYYIKTKNGEHKWVEDNSFAYIDENGKITTSIGILRDTSALQNFISILNDEKVNLDRIFDLADTVLLQFDSDLNIVMINKKGCEVFGGEENELIGKNIDDFVPNEFKILYKQFTDELLGNPEIITRSSKGTIKTLKGESKIIEWHNTVIRDNNGEVVSIISSAQDITARRKERKIKEIILEILEAANTEKNLHDFFKFIHNSISKVMKAENFYIAYYNREEDVLTFPYFVDKFDDDDSPQKLGKGLTEYVIRTGKAVLVDKELDNKLMEKGEAELVGPQSEIWLGVPLTIKDKVIGVIVLQDYENETTYGETEKQMLEMIAYPISRAIERKVDEKERDDFIAKLQELNESKDELFSLISHDLRGPFNSLLGFADILLTEFDTLTRVEMKEYLKVINESAKNLFGMTNNLLHYSRYQLGKYSYEPESLNIKNVVGKILEDKREHIKKKDILIINKIDDDLQVFADEDLLHITIENIIGNAIKFTEEGGTIKIWTDVVFVEREGNEKLNLCIKDDGVGIPKEDLYKIKHGEMFSTAGTMREFGTGLGLPLSRDLCDMNKAQLKIESQVGKGTKVTIQLPIHS